jgi:hypothetical protein
VTDVAVHGATAAGVAAAVAAHEAGARTVDSIPVADAAPRGSEHLLQRALLDQGQVLSL